MNYSRRQLIKCDRFHKRKSFTDLQYELLSLFVLATNQILNFDIF